jgi:hypothetical protein
MRSFSLTMFAGGGTPRNDAHRMNTPSVSPRRTRACIPMADFRPHPDFHDPINMSNAHVCMSNAHVCLVLALRLDFSLDALTCVCSKTRRASIGRSPLLGGSRQSQHSLRLSLQSANSGSSFLEATSRALRNGRNPFPTSCPRNLKTHTVVTLVTPLLRRPSHLWELEWGRFHGAMPQPLQKANRPGESLKMRERVIIAMVLAMVIALVRASWRVAAG